MSPTVVFPAPVPAPPLPAPAAFDFFFRSRPPTGAVVVVRWWDGVGACGGQAGGRPGGRAAGGPAAAAVTGEERRHLLPRVGAAVLAQRGEREELLHPFAVLDLLRSQDLHLGPKLGGLLALDVDVDVGIAETLLQLGDLRRLRGGRDVDGDGRVGGGSGSGGVEGGMARVHES